MNSQYTRTCKLNLLAHKSIYRLQMLFNIMHFGSAQNVGVL